MHIRSLINAFGNRSLGFMILIFAAICAVPLPIPGIHMFLSLPLLCLTGQQIIGVKTVWFPEKVMSAQLPREAFDKFAARAIPLIEKTERLLKPRLLFLTEGLPYRFFAVIAFLLTIVMGAPLWMTNTVPSVAIAVIALGFLTRDGAAILVGTILGIVWTCFLCFVYIGLIVLLFERAIGFFA